MLLLISGPSGAGKSTALQRLMALEPTLAFSISTTTRPPRPGEADGREYDFVDEMRFDALVAADAFVEWAQVHGCRYGTRHAQLQAMQAEGKTPLLDVDVQGGVNVIEHYGDDVVSVFVFPPSWDELERRLRRRGTEDDRVLATRLRNARREVQFAPRYTYWVVNDDLEICVDRLRAILVAERCRQRRLGQPPLATNGG